jgi:hypothetical protein
LISNEELKSLARGYATGFVSMEMLEEELELNEIEIVIKYASTIKLSDLAE